MRLLARMRISFIQMPSSRLASAAPLILFAIFRNATSLAKSGSPPCFGLASIENGEKPQSSVAPS